MEEVICLEKALQGLFNGDLQCRDIDLVETLMPTVSGRGIEVVVGSKSVTDANKDPDL